MTYKQAFQEFYYENKRFILFCVSICLVFSMLAYGKAHLTRASETVTMTETVSTLGGEFGTVFAPVAEGYMTKQQADEINRIQAVEDKRFGDIAIEKKYL